MLFEGLILTGGLQIPIKAGHVRHESANCSVVFLLQCQRGLTVAPGGGKCGRRAVRHAVQPAAGAQTEVQGTHHHVPRRGRRTRFVQEKQDAERQIQEPPTKRRRRRLTFEPQRSRMTDFYAAKALRCNKCPLLVCNTLTVFYTLSASKCDHFTHFFMLFVVSADAEQFK